MDCDHYQSKNFSNLHLTNHAQNARIRLYLAGKIGKNDWRHNLIAGLREHEWSKGPIVAPDYIYVGPFFKSCDHGCNHGPNSHGAAERHLSGESTYSQLDVVRNNNEALDSADLVFVYITTGDCYGTLLEIGRATGQLLRPRVVIAFAPDILVDDFWYASVQADKVYYEVREFCLEDLIAAEIKVLQSVNTAATGRQ